VNGDDKQQGRHLIVMPVDRHRRTHSASRNRNQKVPKHVFRIFII
jgi:hypothetical protein